MWRLQIASSRFFGEMLGGRGGCKEEEGRDKMWRLLYTEAQNKQLAANMFPKAEIISKTYPIFSTSRNTVIACLQVYFGERATRLNVQHAAVRLRAFNSSLSQNAGSTVANNVQGVGRVSKASFFFFFIRGNCRFNKKRQKKNDRKTKCWWGTRVFQEMSGMN